MIARARQLIARLSKVNSNKKMPKRKNSPKEDPAFFEGNSKNFEVFFRFFFFLAMSGFIFEFGGVTFQIPSEQMSDFCQEKAIAPENHVFRGQ